MSYDTDIIIVGGGLNGPAMALAAAQMGARVTVIDRLTPAQRQSDEFDGRSYALALVSVRLLRNIGIWTPDVAANATAMSEIKVSDGREDTGPSPWGLHFQHQEIEEGPFGYMIEDRHLRRAFLAALKREKKITEISDAVVVAQSIDAEGASVTLADGRIIRGRMIIGSDGRQSGTAQRAGIRRQGWQYGQTALVCAIDHEKPHHGIAHQYFLPAGPLAILPLPENRSAIVWTETDANAAVIQGGSDAAYMDILRPKVGDFLGQISLAGKRFTYPLDLTVAEHFVSERLALIGDAAHGMHPIAGQGLNAGLKDVAALAHVMKEAVRLGEDYASLIVLRRYQEWRRFDVATLSFATDVFNKLFSNDNPILRSVRDLGMGLVNSLPSARRAFMREAAGITGDLPELMQR